MGFLYWALIFGAVAILCSVFGWPYGHLAIIAAVILFVLFLITFIIGRMPKGDPS